MFLSLVLHRAETLLTKEFHILFTEAAFLCQDMLDIKGGGWEVRKRYALWLYSFSYRTQSLQSNKWEIITQESLLLPIKDWYCMKYRFKKKKKYESFFGALYNASNSFRNNLTNLINYELKESSVFIKHLRNRWVCAANTISLYKSINIFSHTICKQCLIYKFPSRNNYRCFSYCILEWRKEQHVRARFLLQHSLADTLSHLYSDSRLFTFTLDYLINDIINVTVKT